jgi:membrane-associated phospholipid phosphatase
MDRIQQTNVIISLILFSLIILPVKTVQADDVETAGDILQIAIPAAGFGTTLLLRDWEGSWQFTKHFATTTLVTHSLKYLVEKERPNGSDNKSFPSGHTSAAFQGAAFIHQRYGWKWGIPAYAGATFVGYSRVHSDNHYVEDVIAGAALGMLSGYFFITPYEDVTITPIAGGKNIGLMISKKF